MSVDKPFISCNEGIIPYTNVSLYICDVNEIFFSRAWCILVYQPTLYIIAWILSFWIWDFKRGGEHFRLIGLEHSQQ